MGVQRLAALSPLVPRWGVRVEWAAGAVGLVLEEEALQLDRMLVEALVVHLAVVW